MKSRRVIAALTAAVSISVVQLSAVMPKNIPVSAAENLRLGDIDNDGIISAIDASLVLGEYARLATGQESGFTEEQKIAGDTDRNGKITAVDASSILSYYAYSATTSADEKMSFEQFLGLTDSSIDYSNIPEIDVEDSNELFTVVDHSVQVKVEGYFGVIYENPDGYCYMSKGFQCVESSIEDAVNAFASDGFGHYTASAVIHNLGSAEENFFIVFSENGHDVGKVYKVHSDGYTVETKPVDKPSFWVILNEEKTAERTDGVVVYSVRAKMGYDSISSWDDTAIHDGEFTASLYNAVCRTEPDENGNSNWATIDGFDAGTYYDEFDVYVAANGTYTLTVSDSNHSIAYLTFEVTDVGKNITFDDPYEGLDLTAPKLTIEVPTGEYPEGSVVKVKVTSDEPCVMLIGGKFFGSIDAPVTEAIFEAYYNSSYSVVATDLAHNTTQTSFTVENFVESSIYEDIDETGNIDETGGRNPYDPSNRDNFWDDFADESEE